MPFFKFFFLFLFDSSSSRLALSFFFQGARESPRDRRGSLRQYLGPRLSAGVPQDWSIPQETSSRGSLPGANGDGHRGGELTAPLARFPSRDCN